MANDNGLAEDAYDRSKMARSFSCRFCPRVFRNAQALGGHMNVHRRERALAKDLVQLQFGVNDPHAEGSCKVRGSNYHHKPVHETSTSILHDHFIMASSPVSSSSASSSPPDHHVPTSDFFATSSRLAYNKVQLLRRDSKGRDCPAVDLELRLGHQTP